MPIFGLQNKIIIFERLDQCYGPSISTQIINITSPTLKLRKLHDIGIIGKGNLKLIRSLIVLKYTTRQLQLLASFVSRVRIHNTKTVNYDNIHEMTYNNNQNIITPAQLAPACEPAIDSLH